MKKFIGFLLLVFIVTPFSYGQIFDDDMNVNVLAEIKNPLKITSTYLLNGIARAQTTYATGAANMLVGNASTLVVGGGAGASGAFLTVNNGRISVSNGTIENIVSYDSGGVFGTLSNHPVQIFTNGSEKVRIDASGNTTHISADGSGGGAIRNATSSTGTNPRIELQSYGEDNMWLSFDAYWNPSSGWKSSDVGSNAAVYKTVDRLVFYHDSGVAPGNALSWDDGAYMDLTNGNWTFNSNVIASASAHVGNFLSTDRKNNSFAIQGFNTTEDGAPFATLYFQNGFYSGGKTAIIRSSRSGNNYGTTLEFLVTNTSGDLVQSASANTDGDWDFGGGVAAFTFTDKSIKVKLEEGQTFMDESLKIKGTGKIAKDGIHELIDKDSMPAGLVTTVTHEEFDAVVRDKNTGKYLTPVIRIKQKTTSVKDVISIDDLSDHYDESNTIVETTPVQVKDKRRNISAQVSFNSDVNNEQTLEIRALREEIGVLRKEINILKEELKNRKGI